MCIKNCEFIFLLAQIKTMAARYNLSVYDQNRQNISSPASESRSRSIHATLPAFFPACVFHAGAKGILFPKKTERRVAAPLPVS